MICLPAPVRFGHRLERSDLGPDAIGASAFAPPAVVFGTGSPDVERLRQRELAIPLALYLVTDETGTRRRRTSFRQWLGGEFETSNEHVRSTNAMVEILLPLAAVAVGIVVFAIVAHLVPPVAT